MLTPHPLAPILTMALKPLNLNFNNKTFSEANASLFFIKKLCKFLQSFCFGLFTFIKYCK